MPIQFFQIIQNLRIWKEKSQVFPTPQISWRIWIIANQKYVNFLWFLFQEFLRATVKHRTYTQRWKTIMLFFVIRFNFEIWKTTIGAQSSKAFEIGAGSRHLAGGASISGDSCNWRESGKPVLKQRRLNPGRIFIFLWSYKAFSNMVKGSKGPIKGDVNSIRMKKKAFDIIFHWRAQQFIGIFERLSTSASLPIRNARYY